jgi:hypothetical protein
MSPKYTTRNEQEENGEERKGKDKVLGDVLFAMRLVGE